MVSLLPVRTFRHASLRRILRLRQTENVRFAVLVWYLIRPESIRAEYSIPVIKRAVMQIASSSVGICLLRISFAKRVTATWYGNVSAGVPIRNARTRIVRPTQERQNQRMRTSIRKRVSKAEFSIPTKWGYIIER